MTSRFVLPFADVGSGIVPSDGAQLFFNEPGLETDRDTYSDAAGTIANSNPVIADATGLFSNIYIKGNYDVVLQDKNSVQIWADSVSEFATTADGVIVKNFATLALAVADTGLVDGDALNIAERTTGNSGGAMWNVVLSSTVTENTYNIVQCTGVGTLSLVLRVDGEVDVRAVGCTGDGTTDDSDAGQAAMDISEGVVYMSEGDYLWEGVTVPANTRVYGPGVIKSVVGTSTPSGDEYSKNSVLASGVANITFEGLTFDGGIVGEIGGTEFLANPDDMESPLDIQTCTGVTITNCTFTNVSTQGIDSATYPSATRHQKAKKGMAYILTCTNVLIEKCTLGPNCFVEGFVLLDCSNVIADRNYANLTDDNKRISTPISITGPADENVTRNIVVTNNIFIGHGGSGLNLWGTDGFIITDNIFRGAGIDFSNEGGATATSSPYNINISNNTVDMTGWHSYPSTSQGYGVLVTGISAHRVRSVRILGNTCIRTGFGIFCDFVVDVLIEGNRVENCHGVSAARGLSIATTDCARAQIIGNSIDGEPTAFGTHDGANGAAVLTDSSQAWVVDELDGLTVKNVTNGETAEITSNTSDTITGVLSGGETWDIGDAYTVAAGVCCIYTEDSDDVTIKDNRMHEAGTYLLYLNVDNGKVQVEGNTFSYSVTSPTRNIFGGAAASTNLILKDNVFPLLSSSVDYNTVFSSEDYVTFEDTEVISIATDTVFTFPSPVSYYFIEVSTSGNGNAGFQGHNDGALQSIYQGSDVDITTSGALTGTTGPSGSLNISVSGDTLYVENRLAGTEFFRIKIRG